MAIPFKSPISIDTIVPSSMEPTTKLTLGAYSIKLQSGTNTSIAINGSSSGSLTLTSPNINITNNNNKIILQHNSGQNIYGDTTIKTILQGYPFYIAGDSITEDVLSFDDNGITLGNSIKNTNIKGNTLIIESPNINITKQNNGSFIIPPYTQLSTTDRKAISTSVAVMNDIQGMLKFNSSVLNEDAEFYIVYVDKNTNPGTDNGYKIRLVDTTSNSEEDLKTWNVPALLAFINGYTDTDFQKLYMTVVSFTNGSPNVEEIEIPAVALNTGKLAWRGYDYEHIVRVFSPFNFTTM